MVKSEFIQILENPYKIGAQDLKDLEQIAYEYPYFQAANAVLLKGYKNKGDYRYADLLKKVAALTTDRSVLFEYITQIEFSQEFAVNEIKFLDSENVTEEAETLDVAKAKTSEQTPEQIPVKEEKIKEEEVVFSKELNFEQWIEILTKGIQTIDSKEIELPKSKKVISKFDRIDKFLNEKPKITPHKSNDINIDIAKQSVTENDSVMTETLAKIYVAQKKYTRAIKAYRILSLKYPEKSVFFANQIRAIKKIE
jgi:hypothetical protein